MKSMTSRVGWGVLFIVAALGYMWYLQNQGGDTIAATPTASTTQTTQVTTTAVTGAAPSTNSSAGNELTGDIWRVVYVYDGDTMQVERGGVREKVRIIGIDTPEKGKCGADEARVELEKLLGQDVSLIPGAKTDRDPYDRLLRYVEWPTDGDDFGLHMIEDGYAIARFDRRSNQPHDREDAYIAADAVAQRICPDSAWDRGY